MSVSPSVISVYQWKGKIERENEVMLFIKTSEPNFHNVKELIKKNHSYDVPEIIVLPVSEAEEKYHQWIMDSVF